MGKYVIGIDEVGRGALAGPVVVAAAMIPRGLRLGDGKLGKLKDSKKLSAKQRELWYAHFLVHHQIKFALARVYPRQIEKKNVSRAANLAAWRAFSRLLKDVESPASIFLDGGLFLHDREKQNLRHPNAVTMVKGDEKITAIAVASIIAKVSRDSFMKRLAKRHPDYSFEIHKGYGTKMHLAAIKKNGPCVIHRLTFIALKHRM